jgi:transposase
MSVAQPTAPAHGGLPTPAGPTAGIDWACDDHAVAVVDPAGRQITRFTVAHTSVGLDALVRRLGRAGVRQVAIERPHGPVIDALVAAGLTVVVIAPGQLNALRSRYGQAGNKDDRLDAFVLADVLGTDHHRLRPLQPDTPATACLRATGRAGKDLVGHRVARTNQLRAHLQSAFPGPVGLFHDLDSPISLRFLTRFANQQAADWLSPTRLGAWLAASSSRGRKTPTQLHAYLAQAPRGPIGPDGAARDPLTRALVAAISAVVTQIAALDSHIPEHLELHPDRDIDRSLPRAGTVRAARLLAEIGDSRGRFPTPGALACLAGVAPSTRQSGRHRAVSFRWSCDKQLRDAVCDFAADSRRANPWAARVYQQAIDRGHDHDHAHATRILARAWLGVIWRCWQDHQPYQPAKHRALQALTTNQTNPAA